MMLFDFTKNDSIIHFHLDIIIIRFVSLLLILPLMGGLCPLTLNFEYCKEYSVYSKF